MFSKESNARAATAPPHELFVRKFTESRASELNSLHSIVSHRLDNNFRSQRNKRKRTTGHDDRIAKRKFRKKKIDPGNISASSHPKKEKEKVSRRVRRNIELKKNLPSGFSTSGDGTKRLRTHLWHAKRFTMTKLWGFYVPLGLHGSGRGSRALLKKLKHGVLLHDASYYSCVQLEGQKDTLVSILGSVLDPSPSVHCEDTSQDIIAGNIFETAMLHHPEKLKTAPIAPVTYMWRPAHSAVNAETSNIDVHDAEEIIGGGKFIRCVWVWIHAAAYEEAYDALSFACQKQKEMYNCSTECLSLEGHFGKLDLMGSKVFHLLKKTIVPVICSENAWRLNKCSTDIHNELGEPEKKSIFENEDQFSSSRLVSLVVKDPRESTSKENSDSSELKSSALLNCDESQPKDQAVSPFSKHEGKCPREYIELWDASKGLKPPLEESVVCTERHERRKKLFCLGCKNDEFPTALPEGEYSRVCPVMLLKNINHEDSITRCSIILPLSWVKPFWISLISNGAHAIGLREKHWVSAESNLPDFPLDFPDCNAYAKFMENEALECESKANLRPLCKRPPKIPIPPPWSCVELTYRNICDKTSSKSEENGVEGNLNCEKPTNGTSDCHSSPSEVVIARTSLKLGDFINNNGANHLLLYPRLHDQDNPPCKFMKNGELLNQDSVTSKVKSANPMCFLRVLLQACNEGVFEQGAVICAPRDADVTLWKDRLERDDQTFQVPQSSVRSYFVQRSSGDWELQVPENPSQHEHYRWPIGFITTGFVRGSKKSTAMGFCEASLLSKLREDQWKALTDDRKKKREIYVMVRNLRSTAYKLALATIVLEQQEHDVIFM